MGRADYLTKADHRQEAERLAWVLDDRLQSDEPRTLADVALAGILNALLALDDE